MLYNTLSLDMVEALEDLVSIVPPSLVKVMVSDVENFTLWRMLTSLNDPSPAPNNRLVGLSWSICAMLLLEQQSLYAKWV